GLKRPLTRPAASFAVNHSPPTPPRPPHASPTDSLTRGSRGRSPLVITKGAERLSNDYAHSLIPRTPIRARRSSRCEGARCGRERRVGSAVGEHRRSTAADDSRKD